MKKLIGVLMAMVLVMIGTGAFAYTMEDYNNVTDFAHEKGYEDYYYSHVVDDQYFTCGGIDMEGLYESAKEAVGTDERMTEKLLELIEDGNNHYANGDDPMAWFEQWYENVLNECKIYGNIDVMFDCMGEYNGTMIYHVIVESDEDLCDWIDGDQLVANLLACI